MTVDWEVVALSVGVAASAIGGGAFFAFSNFVMPALGTVAPSASVSAMQAINRAAPSPGFVAALIASAIAGIPVVIAESADLGANPTRLALAGTVLGAISLAITLGRNVPQNDKLETFDPDSSAGSVYWSRYLTSWTRDNTLRCIASLASTVAYAAALVGR